MILPSQVQIEVARLGWALLHFLWQGTAIAVCYAIVRRLLSRSLSAQGRYVLACGALLAVAICPALTFLLTSDLGKSSPITISVTTPQRLLNIVVALWLSGVLAFSIRLAGGWRYAARLRSIANPASPEWQATLRRIAARVDAMKTVRLLVSPLVQVPTVIGWLRPAILLPVDLLAGLPAGHVEALLAHELAHIRRHDYLANVLQGVAETVLFYHPAVWWISEQIRMEREQCCDDLAVAAAGDALAYAQALAALELRQPRRWKPVLAANGGSLVDRIRRLIDPAHATPETFPGRAPATAMALLCLAGLGGLTVHASQPMSVAHAVRARIAGLTTPAAKAAQTAIAAVASGARQTLLYDPLLRPRRTPRAFVWPVSAVSQRRVPVLPADPAPLTTSPIGDSDTGLARLAQMPPLPAPPPFEEPATATFRAAARLVQIDVVARKGSSAAKGLSKEDFVLLDNGQPRQIALFSANSQLSARRSPLLPDHGALSNRLQPDSAASANGTVILIDQSNTSPGDQAFVIRRVANLLRRRRGSPIGDEPIGIYVYDRQGIPRIIQELTTDPGLLSQAADALRRQAPITTDAGLAERAIETSECLQAVARHLAGVPGRKNLIWISAAFPLMEMEGSDRLADFNALMDAAARALTDAAVAFYAVDARGLPGAIGSQNAESPGPPTPAHFANFFYPASIPPALNQALETVPITLIAQRADLNTNAFARLAQLTGGLAFHDSNAIDDSIGNALDDASLGYTLGFYAEPGVDDAAWHRLKVEVKRHGVRLRYREKYFAPGMPEAGVDAAALRALLKDPLDATGLELMARAAPDTLRPGFRHVHVSIDLRQVHLEQEDHVWVGSVEIAFLREGARAARMTEGKLRIPDDQLARALEDGLSVDDSIAVDGASSALRVVAQDRATGAAGTLTIPLVRR